MRRANSMAGAVNHAPASAWLQKFALFDKSFPEGPYDRPSGPQVVCSQSLPAATVRERSRDCRPIIYCEFMQPSTSNIGNRLVQQPVAKLAAGEKWGLPSDFRGPSLY